MDRPRPPDPTKHAEALGCLRTAFAASSDAVLLVREERVVFANARAVELLGTPEADLIGRRLHRILERDDPADTPNPDRRPAGLPELPPDGGPLVAEHRVTRADGTTFQAETRRTRMDTPDGPVDHCQIRDLAPQRTMERRLDSSRLQRDRVSQVLRTLGHMNHAVLNAETPEGLLNDTCQILCNDRGYDLVWIGLTDDLGTLDVVARYPASPGEHGCQPTPDAIPTCAQLALRGGEPVVVTAERPNEWCDTCEAPQRDSNHSTMALPLQRNDRPAGVLMVHARRSGLLDIAERALLADIALSLGYAIDNLHITRRERRRTEELLVLNRVTRAALESHGNTGHLATTLVSSLTATPEIQDCEIVIWDERRESIVNRAASPGMGRRGLPPASKEATGLILADDQPVACDTGLRPESSSIAAGTHPNEPIIGVPLTAGDAHLGAAFLVMGPEFRCSQEDLDRTARVAEHLALAIARTLASQVNQRRLGALLALHETGLDLSGRRELQPLLDAIVDRAGSLLETTVGGLYLMNRERLHLTVARGELEGFIGRSIGLGEGAAGRAVHRREPVIVDDYQQWPGRARLYAETNVSSVVAVPIVWRGEILGALHVEHTQPARFGPEEAELVTLFADQAAVAIANARLIDGLKDAAKELTESYDATLEGWVRALDLRDQETEGHTQRVTELTLRLARTMDLDQTELVHVRRGALLHDIGKIGIPDSILRKPGPLSAAELAVMRRHPEFARDMLAPITHLRPALAIPYSHHERWDGTGYPQGLAGNEIPLAARIFAVVDVFDAMHSDRPYRRGIPKADVVSYLQEHAGTQFDPAVVETFIDLLDE